MSAPTSSRHPSAAALLLALVSAGGCVHARIVEEPPASTSFQQPLETSLGAAWASEASEHPGESGLRVLESGLDAFAARVGLIDRAERAIDLQVYIFHDDVTGRIVLQRLLAAADRGVRVRLLLDDLGSAGIDELTAAADAHPGLEVRLFNPFARGPWPGVARMLDMAGRPRRLNHRMHNKLLTVDGAAAIAGGRNVGDEYFDARDDVGFADLDLLVVGPVVRQLGREFDLYWNSPFAFPLSAWASLRRGPRDLARLQTELEAHLEEQRDSPYAERLRRAELVQQVAHGELWLLWAPVTAVADLPRKVVARGDEVAETLLTHRAAELMPRATSELLVVSPYFVPRREGADRLVERVGEGVRVRVLTNSLAATDVGAVHAGYARSRRRLLRGGVELYELRPRGGGVEDARGRGVLGSSAASLHAKTYGIDRRVVFVGSLNLDPRSVELNTELGLVVESEELAARLARGFEELAGPAFSWRPVLEDSVNGPRLAWHGEEDGRGVRLYTEPGTSFLQRLQVALLGLLPIEGQL